MTITERMVQNALYWELRTGHDIIIPNYTPSGWWECDVYGLTRSGYSAEHEIKLTLPDYRNDFHKSHRIPGTGRRVNRQPYWDTELKHDLLQARDARGPSRFWYVMPDGLVPIEDIPAYAGLRTFKPRGTHGRIDFTIVRPAPQLHKVKPDTKIKEHIFHVFYPRYWNIRLSSKINDDGTPVT